MHLYARTEPLTRGLGKVMRERLHRPTRIRVGWYVMCVCLTYIDTVGWCGVVGAWAIGPGLSDVSRAYLLLACKGKGTHGQ